MEISGCQDWDQERLVKSCWDQDFFESLADPWSNFGCLVAAAANPSKSSTSGERSRLYTSCRLFLSFTSYKFWLYDKVFIQSDTIYNNVPLHWNMKKILVKMWWKWMQREFSKHLEDNISNFRSKQGSQWRKCSDVPTFCFTIYKYWWIEIDFESSYSLTQAMWL